MIVRIIKALFCDNYVLQPSTSTIHTCTVYIPYVILAIVLNFNIYIITVRIIVYLLLLDKTSNSQILSYSAYQGRYFLSVYTSNQVSKIIKLMEIVIVKKRVKVIMLLILIFLSHFAWIAKKNKNTDNIMHTV